MLTAIGFFSRTTLLSTIIIIVMSLRVFAFVLLLLASLTRANVIDPCSSECLLLEIIADGPSRHCLSVTALCNITDVVVPHPLLDGESLNSGNRSPPLWGLNATGACCLRCIDRVSQQITRIDCIDNVNETTCDVFVPFAQCPSGTFLERTFAPGDACRGPTQCPVSPMAGACCNQCINTRTGNSVQGKTFCENTLTREICDVTVPPPPAFSCDPAMGELRQRIFTPGDRCRTATRCPPSARGGACCLECNDPSSTLHDCINVASVSQCDAVAFTGCVNVSRLHVPQDTCRGQNCPVALPSAHVQPSHTEPVVCDARPVTADGCTQNPDAAPCELGDVLKLSINECGSQFFVCFDNTEIIADGGDIGVVVNNTCSLCPQMFGLACASTTTTALPTTTTTTTTAVPTTTTTTTGNGDDDDDDNLVLGLTIAGVTIVSLILLCLCAICIGLFATGRAATAMTSPSETKSRAAANSITLARRKH